MAFAIMIVMNVLSFGTCWWGRGTHCCMRHVYLAIQAIASYVQEIKGIFRKLIEML